MEAAASVGTITIRNLDTRVKERLRVRAARNGRSMEAEARSILAATLEPEVSEVMSFVEAIRRHVEPLGGIELGDHPQVVVGDPPSFGR